MLTIFVEIFSVPPKLYKCYAYPFIPIHGNGWSCGHVAISIAIKVGTYKGAY